MNDEVFDFEATLAEALAAIDVGPHCSCAEVTAEVLRRAIAMESPVLQFAAAGFGGGLAGSGSICGAFSAGIVAIGMVLGERERSEGCISETIAPVIQAYYDDWIDRHGSVLCSSLTGYASMRDENIRDEFFAGGGQERCTDNYIRFAVERTLQVVNARRE